MSDTVNIKFRLQGLDFNQATWAELKEFLDKLLPALAAMDGGPAVDTVLPIAIEPGSLIPVLRTPRAALPGVYRLRSGPTRQWTTEQRRKAGALYNYLDARGLQLSCGVRALHPVKVPTDRTTWRLRERMTVTGEVRRIGGTKGRVEMGLEGFGHVHCAAGREIAKQLATHLYERVVVAGLAERDVNTGAITEFKIDSFQPMVAKDFAAGLQALHDLLEEDVDSIDPAKILREM